MTRLAWRSPGEEATLRFGVMLGPGAHRPRLDRPLRPVGRGEDAARRRGCARARIRGASAQPVLRARAPLPRPAAPFSTSTSTVLTADDEDLRAGWEEEPDVVVLVEWAERVTAPPPGAITVRLVPEGETCRLILLDWVAGTSPVGHLGLEALREESAAEDSANPGPGREPRRHVTQVGSKGRSSASRLPAGSPAPRLP